MSASHSSATIPLVVGLLVAGCTHDGASGRRGAITVSSPAPGESWVIGEARAINWLAPGVAGLVRIELARGPEAAWETIVASTENDGSQEWTVAGPPANHCRLRVVAVGRPSVRGESAETFRIGLGRETTTAAFTDVSPPANQRWMDIAGNLYSAEFQATYTYSMANVQVTYKNHGLTFVALLQASGLKPNFAYQVKLVGDRNDAWSFEALGYLGRWWLDLGGTNFTDADYEAHKDDPAVTIAAYLLFDCFVTDGEGRATKYLYLDSSYHVIWSKELNPGNPGPGPEDGAIFAHTFEPDEEAYPTPDSTPTTQHLWLEQEWINLRPPIGEVQLPAGVYPAYLQLTEESFHQSGLGGQWATVLSTPVSFIIAGP